jgi:predicted ABC-type transport system involved in lysophospholipase L1 biosynthesis ATPase subunit
MSLLRELHGDGLTLILVTHDPGIGASAPRLVRMRDGAVVSDDRREAAPASSTVTGG